MSERENKGAVPVLRFPEFRDAGEWEEKKLRVLANRITEKNRESKVTRVLTNSAVDGIVDQRAYFDKDIANQNNLSGYNIVNKGDYVYNPRISSAAPVGPISKNMIGRGVMSPLYTVFRFKNDNNDFYEQYFKSAHWHRYLRQVSNSGVRHDRMSITNDDFEKTPLPAPTPKEQQKIADCLSAIDDLIAAHTKKHEALKAHKKGLTQQLFPAEAEIAPELRFRGFLGMLDRRELGHLTKILRGGSPRPIDEYVTNEASGLNWLKIADVAKDSKYVISTKEKVSISALSKTREVNPGDLIMSNSMSFGRPYILKIKSCIHDGWLAITEIAEEIDRDYLYYFILSPTSQAYFVDNAAGSGVKNLNADIVKLLPVYFPGFTEQQLIADCLYSIDDLIAAQTQTLEALKSHKNGLMQQLFPALDGVNE